MGVVGTFCQLCGLPTQFDHYVPTKSGMLKIYRGSSANGGHQWESDEHPFPFGPEHEWLKDAVVLPWDEECVLRGPIEDGAIDDGKGGSILVWDGGDDGLALHHACWELEGSPGSTGPAVRANSTHGWALVEGYHEQLFEFQELAADGKAWMLADPRTDARSRERIEGMLAVARVEVTDPAKTLEEIVSLDRDWSCMAIYDDRHVRKSLVRARMYAIEEVDKTGYGALVRVTREYPGPAAMADLEAFEIGLKASVERGAQAVLAVVGIGKGRAEYLIYARDGARTKSLVPVGDVAVSDDPGWSEAPALIRSLR